ncbi:hypothetical protein [Salinibacter altiplanensis]|uniref:hypothetical protein n=1 Tax=Salinibacter altiplanensis TaxID=1803181 RepID=UPI001F15E2FC|nr:hypothetical protein [Salinibacter altiplanensis]
MTTFVSPGLPVATILTVGVLLMGCDSSPLSADSPQETSAQQQQAELSSPGQSGASGISDRFERLFAINLSIDEQPSDGVRPQGGNAVQLKVGVRKKYSVGVDATFDLILPELTPLNQARTQGVETAAIPLGEPLEKEVSKEVSKTVSFQNQESNTLKQTIPVPEPGYYMVVADIQSTTESSQLDISKIQQLDTGVRKEAWLWVGEGEVRLTDTFREGIFPEAYSSTPESCVTGVLPDLQVRQGQ